jgi:hypothetical protein
MVRLEEDVAILGRATDIETGIGDAVRFIWLKHEDHLSPGFEPVE